MLKNRRTTLERIDKFISREYFTDVNLYGRIYPKTCPLKSISVYSCGLERPKFEQILQKRDSFVPTSVGSQFGPTWSTHWFKIVLQIPPSWIGKQVHLKWNSESEAMLWSPDGTPLSGFSGDVDDKQDYILSRSLKENELDHVFFVEMACNKICGVGAPLLISPPVPDKMFTLKTAEIAVFNTQVNKLIQALKILFDIAERLPESNPRSYEALYTGNDIINILQMEGDQSYQKALARAENFFKQFNGQTQHELIAVGHCHIDCAWLWTYAETIRKCARSWASVVNLMEQHPNFTFACSQAQQFAWVKEHYPKLYEKIKFHVARGKFLPVGGTWVEMDGNIPSGESFIRQFLYGQRFFKEEFGNYCSEFWLPDTFGYSAQLPQVMRHMGISRFLTQKLSWSLVNKFPHHNFFWEGLDGSTVIVHFPPGDSYEMKVTVEDAMKSVTNLMDKGRVSKSLMLFGYGDGGGGPTEAMLERQQLLQDVDGIPKISLGTPTQIFEHLESSGDKLCHWSGELYLELHNATYTTQADMKKLNRICEFLLHNLEFLYSVLKIQRNVDYPREEIDRMWKTVLLNQFHDVLPGTSIKEAHVDARNLYMDVLKQGHSLQEFAAASFNEIKSDGSSYAFINTLSWPRTEIVTLPDGSNAVACVPSMGVSAVQNNCNISRDDLQVLKQGSGYFMKNKYISALLNSRGEVTSLKLLETNEEYIAPGSVGNHFVVFDDVPLYWDAWDVMDYHMETKRSFLTSESEAEIKHEDVTRASLNFVFPYGNERFLNLKILIDAVHPYLQFQVSISWGPVHKFLKVEFPVNVRAQQATYEIQFGHLQRATHYNTSWDWAKYEVCAHKWMDLSEYGKGVAVLNNCKYGHSVHKNIMTLSLLRSPTNPDPTTDQQIHDFVYAIMPHKGCFQEAGVIQQSYALNCPLLVVPSSKITEKKSTSFFGLSKDSVIIESVKLAESRNDAIILRLYEAFGGHFEVTLSTTLLVSAAEICNGLEERISLIKIVDGCVSLTFGPFEIVSLMLKF